MRSALALFALSLLCGCAGMLRDLGSGLEAGLRNHDDPATVAAGLPAYLLLLDGLVEERPDDPGRLALAASLYATYAGSFAGGDRERAARLAARSLGYARRLACLEPGRPLCQTLDGPIDAFATAVAAHPARDVDTLAVLGTSWAAAIRSRAEDLRALAALPKVQALLERVAVLDPSRGHGTVLVYLGVLHSLRPAALGGAPERGRAAFEEAIRRSNGRNLMAKVLYAEHYARLVFDRGLHDRLLDEVLAADPVAPGLTLSNVLAMERARELKESADAYF
ncbi:MAG: hypothetical protein KatS3mg126_2244 [Lysobacteraceae bacterium]|nr:MAG: hypothetical protein KatS3mg126_2244 [Xanthomonadaceae bacterium]